MAAKKTTKKATKKARPTGSQSGRATKTAKKAVASKPAPKKTPKKKKEEEVAQKLRIRVRAYDHKVLDGSIRQIMDIALRFDADVLGPIPLPTEKKGYTVNRSSFVHKNAREQYEMRVHKRLIDIQNPSAKVVEALTNINLPSGVSIEVKMI